jgi:hypothetical protein
MKTTTPTFYILVLLLGIGSSLAGSEKSQAKSTPSAVKHPKALSQPESYTPQTGTYIKNKVRRSGLITDGSSQLVVIDHNVIERSGASDLRQLLTHRGFGR